MRRWPSGDPQLRRSMSSMTTQRTIDSRRHTYIRQWWRDGSRTTPLRWARHLPDSQCGLFILEPDHKPGFLIGNVPSLGNRCVEGPTFCSSIRRTFPLLSVRRQALRAALTPNPSPALRERGDLVGELGIVERLSTESPLLR